MSLWFLLALMTAVAVFAVLWPLGRNAPSSPGGRESAVYKDQLAEVDRDVSAGLIRPAEGEAARVEISRRLLAAADLEADTRVTRSLGWRRGVAIAALVGVPLLAGAVYLQLGSPQLADIPLAGRAVKPQTASLEQLVGQVRAHLEKNPTDGRGWGVLAPVLERLGQFDDAAQAYRNAIRYDGDTAARRSGLGEALAGAANGVVTADAKSEFDRAVALDAGEPKARYFLGVAAEQDGRTGDARAIWQALLDAAPQDAAWRPVVTAALVRVGAAKVPAASDDAIASAQNMSEADRSTMIRGMVERLATRLKQNGDDVEGWLRLVRAYKVLNETDNSRTARDDARRALERNDAGLRRLNEGLKALGIEG